MQDQENIPTATDDSELSVSALEANDQPNLPTTEEERTPVTSPAVEPGEQEELPEEASRGRKAFRKLIRWTVGLLIIFGLGFLTAIFTIYNPKVEELGQSKNDLLDASVIATEMETQISSLQAEINNLNSQINALDQKVKTLEDDKQKLIEQQDTFNLHIALLKTRANVVSAQVELYANNPAQARVLLESTSQSLIELKSLLPEDLIEVITPLENRLDLVIGEIEDDPETAIADLDILAGDLLEIENALFNN